MKKTNEKAITIVTHNGKFHADEIFALACLKIIYGLIHIIRSRDPKDFEGANYVIDVGGKYDGERFFDHHQRDFEKKYSDGTKLASFGLIWEKFGERIISKLIQETSIEKISVIFNRVTTDFVKIIDNGDNGEGNIISPESSIISGMNLSSKYIFEEDRIQLFHNAIDIAEKMIFCHVDHAICNIERDLIINMGLSARKDKKILTLYKGTDWSSIIDSNPEILFVVFPGMEEEKMWYVQCVPPEKKSFEQKCPLPSNWAGKRGEELQNISGVETAVFCHVGKFIGGAATKEDAEKMAIIASAGVSPVTGLA